MAMKIFTIMLLLLALLFGCNRAEPIRVSMVYDNTLPYGTKPSEKNSSVKDQYYYVYGYKNTDLHTIIKMLDTLAIDTGYSFHTYRFYQYNSSLPDTGKLKRLMVEGALYNGLKEFPGDSKFYKSQILQFSFMRHYTSEGKKFPDSYSIKIHEKENSNQENTRYYLRDSLSKKMVEVGEDSVFPKPVNR